MLFEKKCQSENNLNRPSPCATIYVMDDFQKYLSDTGQTIGGFAARVGISRPYMSEIMRGLKTPSLRVAADISAATGGVIPVTYWLERKKE